MGFLLEIYRIAKEKEIKCTQCGNKTVFFVERQGKVFIECQNCGVETEITKEEIKAISDTKAKLE